MNIFDEINLFNNTNKALKQCFLFFFFVAVCGYISVMVSSCPYNDDYPRYMANIHVGTIAAARHMTFLLELLMYLSNVVTDAAPFTQIISCALLAYCAVLCLKIFNIDIKDRMGIKDRWAIVCFIPIIINPYILEVMLYRFDNIFMTIPLLFAIFSAYLSVFNNKRWLFAQTALLVIGLLMYQAAISAYFTIFVYLFLKEIMTGAKLAAVISKMRYWFLTLLLTACFYIPFALSLTYCVQNGESVLIIPKNFESIRIIVHNIARYFSIFYTDWALSAIGQIFLAIITVFFIGTVSKTVENTKSIVAASFSAIVVFFLFLCPIGLCLLVRVICFEGNESILPRILYTIGILISLILHDTYLLFKCTKYSEIFYKFLLSSIVVWNIVFSNSVGNIIRCLREVQQHVFYDISKDIFEITNENKKITRVCVIGSVRTQAMANFFKLYPIMERIIPEKWSVPSYSQIVMMNSEFANMFWKHIPVCERYIESEYQSKKLLKKHMLYDLFILDNRLLLISLKEEAKFEDPLRPFVRIRNE